MEYEKVFATVGFVTIAIIAYFTMMAGFNADYGTSIGESSNATYSKVQTLGTQNLFNVSTAVGNSTDTQSGAGTSNADSDLLRRGLGVLTVLPRLLGLIPAIMQDFAIILGVPSAYVSIASWIFIFSFAILFAYLLIVGVRRLV